jgi:hypothetical protein
MRPAKGIEQPTTGRPSNIPAGMRNVTGREGDLEAAMADAARREADRGEKADRIRARAAGEAIHVERGHARIVEEGIVREDAAAASETTSRAGRRRQVFPTLKMSWNAKSEKKPRNNWWSPS